jgi:hypothetical protein
MSVKIKKQAKIIFSIRKKWHIFVAVLNPIEV